VYLQYVRVHLDQGASDIHRPAHHSAARTHLVQRRTYDPSGADPPGPPRPCSSSRVTRATNRRSVSWPGGSPLLR